MIKVSISKKNNIIDHIMVEGHALYDDYGKDIVCASVSSIVITSVNAILRIDKAAISCNKQDGIIDIQVIKMTDVVNILLVNMIELLKELAQDYPDNVLIK